LPITSLSTVAPPPHLPLLPYTTRFRSRRGTGTLLAAFATVPRRFGGPRRDVPVGPRRAAAHGPGADRDRASHAAGGERRRGDRAPRVGPVAQAARDAGAARVDAGDERPRGRGAGTGALRHPGAGAPTRVHDRADPERRHLLHEPVR